MDLIDGPGLFVWLRRHVGSSKHLKIAVAFWGEGAAKQLDLGQNKEQETKIVCNLRMGGTNPREIEQLMNAGEHVQVRHSDTLHAKIYLLDEGGAVGSSNISANGLSFQGKECGGWTEANVVFRDNSLYKATAAKFNEIWQLAKPVKKQGLNDAYEAWSARRRHLPFRNGLGVENRTLLDVLRNDPASLADRRIYVVVWRYLLEGEAQNALEREQIRAGEGANIDAFGEWPELPNDADLITFYLGPRGGALFSGFWNIPRGEQPFQLENGGTIHYCYKRNDIRGIFDPGPMEGWRPLIRQTRNSEFWDVQNSRALVEFGDFARKCCGWKG